MLEKIDNRRKRPDRKKCICCMRWYFKDRKDQITCGRESCRKARKLWWQRQHMKSGTRIENMVKRICLACSQPFWSHEHRICPRCHERNAKYESHAQAWG